VTTKRAGRRDFGNIRKQRNGRFQARYKGPDGTVVNGPHTFATKTDASLWLDSERARIQGGTWANPKASQRLLADYAEEWLLHRKGPKGRPLAIKTRELYAHLIKFHIKGEDNHRKITAPVPRIGSMPLGQITPSDIRRWHTDRLAHTGQTQVRQAYSLLRAIFNTAIEDALITRNPCAIKGAGQYEAKERPLLEWADVHYMADHIADYLRPLVLLAFDAHLREGEIIGIQRRDIDLDACQLHVRRQVIKTKLHGDPDREGQWALVETTPKADSLRTVDLSDWCVGMMRQHMARTGPALPSARLFTRPDGQPLQPHHIQNAWRWARPEHLAWSHFHDLRAAGLTLVMQLGATIKEAQGRAGHADPRAAMLYQRKATASRGRDLAARLSLFAAQQAAEKEAGSAAGDTAEDTAS
jgi:integrase